MAYFDCIVGGSGKGNTLVVTCADDLAGATITCTNGTKTYTKTCPSTAPYEVTFYGLAAGTWTVSATVSGNTYTTTVVITDYEAELGGFNWRTWVDLSKNYTSSDFTDLDELLDTELAVRELMSIHACVDYLAGIAAESADVETIIGNDLCAKWINNRDYALDTLYANTIIADYMDTADKYFYGEWVITDNTTTPPTWGPKGNVPVLTSNTAPYGSTFAKSTYQSRYAYLAFDNNESTSWASNTGDADEYIGYLFVNPIKAKRAHLVENGMLGTFQIMASDIGGTYVAVSEVITGKGTAGATYDIELNSDRYYQAYKLQVLSHASGSAYSYNISTLQFYGRELSVSVPKMDTNTTPYGEASASSIISGYEAYKAFDNDPNTRWNNNASSVPAKLIYKFTRPTCVRAFTLTPAFYDNLMVKEFEILGSNDGVSWSDPLYSETLSNATQTITRQFANDTEYLYYAINVKSTYHASGTSVSIISLQFYGLDYSEKEFEEGSTKKWLYDHGVELVTIVTNTYGSGSSVTKGSQSIYLKNSSSANNSASLNAELDLSPYSLARAKIFNCLASGSVMGSIAVTATTADVNDTRIATINMNTNNGNDYALGLTSINQTYYVAMLCAASAASNPREMEVTEFWLE